MQIKTKSRSRHSLIAVLVAGCGVTDADEAPEGADEAALAEVESYLRAGDASRNESLRASVAFARRGFGVFEQQFAFDTGGVTAHVVSTLTITPTREAARTEAFADPEHTVRILSYESEGPYDVVGFHPASPDSFALSLRNTRSELTIFVDDPALEQAIGLDDCDLEVGVPKDVSNGCAAPIFSVASCIDLDVFEVSPDGQTLRTGQPGTDRCRERPTALDETPFHRVADISRADLLRAWWRLLVTERAREMLEGDFVAPRSPISLGPDATVWIQPRFAFDAGRLDARIDIFGTQGTASPLATYELGRNYLVAGPATDPAAPRTSFAIDFFDVDATLTLHEPAPALIAAAGLDDCNLQVGVPTDVTSGCAAPAVPFSTCLLEDIVQLRSGGRIAQFGDPSGDRCAERPTQLEAFSFERVRR